ncbi:hypothetical protein Trydic_g20862 [Trypoxylus dichotomus]
MGHRVRGVYGDSGEERRRDKNELTSVEYTQGERGRPAAISWPPHPSTWTSTFTRDPGTPESSTAAFRTLSTPCKVEYRHSSREKHASAFLDKRTPSKRTWRPSRIHHPRRCSFLTTPNQIP